MPHPHADKMKQYAEDAEKYDEPWKSWEFKPFKDASWFNLDGNPQWSEQLKYRRKPKKWEPKPGAYALGMDDWGDLPEFQRDDPDELSELSSLVRRMARLHAWRCENGEPGRYVAYQNARGEWFYTGIGPVDSPGVIGMRAETAKRCVQALNSGELDLDG